MRGIVSGGAAVAIIASAIAVAAFSSGVGPAAADHDPYHLNEEPDCSAVTVTPSTLSNTDQLVLATLSGATDADNDPLTYHIDGVTQDEPVLGPADRTEPDADFTANGPNSASVYVRAERSPKGNGRVYVIAYTVSDGEDTCNGTELVGVPRKKNAPAVLGADRWNSFTGAPA